MIYRNPKDGRTQEVGANERRKREVLERAGWRAVEDEQAPQGESVSATASSSTLDFDLGDGATLTATVTAEDDEGGEESQDSEPIVPPAGNSPAEQLDRLEASREADRGDGAAQTAGKEKRSRKGE